MTTNIHFQKDVTHSTYVVCIDSSPTKQRKGNKKTGTNTSGIKPL